MSLEQAGEDLGRVGLVSVGRTRRPGAATGEVPLEILEGQGDPRGDPSTTTPTAGPWDSP